MMNKEVARFAAVAVAAVLSAACGHGPASRVENGQVSRTMDQQQVGKKAFPDLTAPFALDKAVVLAVPIVYLARYSHAVTMRTRAE